MYIPKYSYLRRSIMDEIHKMRFRHPSYQKMITATMKKYFWFGMKKDIVVQNITRCMNINKLRLNINTQ